MRFELKQRFDHHPDLVGHAYASPELYPTLVGLPKLGGITVLNSERDGATARLSIRFAFTGELPAAVTAVVDPARLTWIQESVHDLATGITTFDLLPDHYPDRLQASGTAVLTPDGDGARRVVSGTLKVRAPLVAHRVEEAIVNGLEEYLVAEAPAVERYLSDA